MPPGSSKNTVEIHGYALRVIRERSGREIADLAASLGVDRSYITKIERGSSRRVGAPFYSRLLAELAIDDYRVLLANAPVRAEAAAS